MFFAFLVSFVSPFFVRQRRGYARPPSSFEALLSQGASG